jgi:hypothetical protein
MEEVEKRTDGETMRWLVGGERAPIASVEDKTKSHRVQLSSTTIASAVTLY